MNQKNDKSDQINKEGARRYNEGVRENAPDSDEQAREAAEALDRPEGKDLRRAERAGKAAAKQPRH